MVPRQLKIDSTTFLNQYKENDYKKSRLILFLELTSVQRSDLTAVLFAVSFSGSMQDDACSC